MTNKDENREGRRHARITRVPMSAIHPAVKKKQTTHKKKPYTRECKNRSRLILVFNSAVHPSREHCQEGGGGGGGEEDSNVKLYMPISI